MPVVNLPTFLANRLRAAGSDLYAACEKMPDDRLAWHPPVEGNTGRDALDQLVECGYLNSWAATAFRNGALPPLDATDYKYEKDAHRDRASALRWLREGTNDLAAAVEAFPADRLGETFTNPITDEPTTWAEFADFFYWNTIYHEGQVNYIQVLYGDIS
ncbi:MAG TPA: DinB family protein [Chthonomonadaceae bacterium]|nr:DinB family protein [Chthonomonadaceae bacterium]